MLSLNLEIGGKLGSERLGKIGDGRIEIEDGGMLEALHLINDGVHHLGVAVATSHGGDPAERVQVSPPLVVVQILHLPIYQTQLGKTKTQITFTFTFKENTSN